MQVTVGLWSGPPKTEKTSDPKSTDDSTNGTTCKRGAASTVPGVQPVIVR